MTRMTCAVCAALLFACTTEDVEDLDPAGTNGDEQWADEGPREQDVASDIDDVPVALPDDELVEIAAGRPLFQLPFPCGQVWAGQTRTNHSPSRAVDFNRANDLGDTVVAAAGGTVTRVADE